VDGKEVLPELLAAHGEVIAEHAGMPLSVLAELGVVPSYYLRYFYFHDDVVREEKQRPSRAAEVAAIERELMELYGDPTLDTKPELLAKRGGAFYSEAAVALVASLFGGTAGDVGDGRAAADGEAPQVVNVRNFGTLPFLADDAVIEVPAAITAAGPAPVPVAPIEPLYRGLIAHVSAYEELALDAALHGGRSRVEAALLAHPLVGQYDTAKAMADRLMAENAQFLSWA
jgi:6-phospho-beta-glucosidase